MTKPHSKSKAEDRLLVEIGRKRVPLKQILHGKEIRDAMAALEKFRQQFNEKEFFYGGRVYLDYSQGECVAVCKRPETDKEYNQRQAWLQEEARKKAERARIKQLREHEREQQRVAKEAAERAAAAAREIETLRELAEKHGMKLVDSKAD